MRATHVRPLKQTNNQQPIFLKLGGSLITDKTKVEHAHKAVIRRLAREIKAALNARPDLQLVLGHGSGSFGHVAAKKHGTRDGVQDRSGWLGYAEVAAAAARLNQIVTDVFVAEGVPVVSVPPSASARCEDGTLVLSRHVCGAHAAGKWTGAAGARRCRPRYGARRDDRFHRRCVHLSRARVSADAHFAGR